MRYLRKLVYKMGFRPKPSSIFYSPSREWWAGVNENQERAAAVLRHIEQRSKLRRDLGLPPENV